MPINIYSVQDHLESEGWGLISDKYVNLKSPLKIICPNGHEQEVSYEDWRRRKTCETCLIGNNIKFRKNSVPEKGDNYRILALDAATIDTGYAIFDGKNLVAFGAHHIKPGQDLEERISEFKTWLEQKLEDWQPDFVGVEDIQLQQNNVVVFKGLANLQGVVINTLFEHDVPHELVFAEEWRKTLGVSGKNRAEKKKDAQDKALKWYNRKCTQDEADAICIGKYFTLKGPKKEFREGFFI